MKNLNIFLALFLMVFVAHAQNLPVDANTGKITFIEVVDAAGLSDKDLYKIALEWGKEKNFTIKSQDEAAGTVVFNASTPVEYDAVKSGKKDKGSVNFTYSVFCKSGKYRYIVTDFVHEGAAGSGGKLENTSADCGKDAMVAKSWVYIKNSTQSQVNALIEDLKKKIKETQNDPAKNSDW